MAAGQVLPMIGRLLGHTQVQATARSAHLAADPVRAAAEHISSNIAAISRTHRPLRRGAKNAGIRAGQNS